MSIQLFKQLQATKGVPVRIHDKSYQMHQSLSGGIVFLDIEALSPLDQAVYKASQSRLASKNVILRVETAHDSLKKALDWQLEGGASRSCSSKIWRFFSSLFK